jgi:hypothetical protein
MATAAERFWAKVAKTDTCWLWTAATQGGYGVFRVSSTKQVKAHRWAYESLVGPIPEGLTLDHLCRVRNCVNPEHLDPCTTGVNTLRGDSGSARNARKTHCLNGHPLEGDNLMRDARGMRQCRICQRERVRRWMSEHYGKGVGKGAAQRAKTHCPQGHPYDQANTYVHPTSGGRLCRTCRRDDNRRRKKAA